MAKRAVIRMGDRTSHDGTVTEGFPELMVYGKPAAGIGHAGSCPKCKTTFHVVAGAETVTVFGKALALEGMKTSCGAVLIASQTEYTVDDGAGAASDLAGFSLSGGAATTAGAQQTYDEQFTLRDESTGNPLAGISYKATSTCGAIFKGTTDAAGRTTRMRTASGETLTLEILHGEVA